MEIRSILCGGLLFLFSAGALAGECVLLEPKTRTPQYPLKTQRTLFTEARRAVVRENIERYAAAKAIADQIVERAKAWVAWSDEDLRGVVAGAEVPRAFNVGTEGCPKCGKAIYEAGGTYPWIVHPRRLYTVECPICGGVFPDNDYAGWYKSGFKDKSFLSGQYADDGWGWVGPEGRKYWFVANANHWVWSNHVQPAIQNLARAYGLTGDKAFAHKAAVLLTRVAEVYPAMDHATQSRYGELTAARGGRYEGKILNAIWETGVLTLLAESYDLVWETIDGDSALQQLTGKSGEQLRASIEANILEEGIECCFNGKIRGNFGMHQESLAYAGLVRQYGKQAEWFDGLMTLAADSPLNTGLNYALYNLVYRDGVPYETSPGYNFSWVANITSVAESLRLTGRDVYAIPKMRRLYDGVLDVVNAGQFTPAVGDSGNVYGGLTGQDGPVYQAAYRAYSDPRYLQHLTRFGAVGEAGFRTFETLFSPPIPPGDAQAAPAPAVSRLLDGYGMGILNNGPDTVSLALYYGYMGGHGHFDRLSFELFANGHPMMPDTGYPDFMNAFVPGIYTWSKNTVAHNTVVVDAARQTHNEAGRVNLFAGGSFARVIDVQAGATYAQCPVYRRMLALIDADAGHAYAVDLFLVEGGKQHDYSLHGAPGAVSVLGGEWTPPAPGTLAGADVPLGACYDAPEMNVPGYTGAYSGYRGSGFQHFTQPQRRVSGDWMVEYAHEKDPQARLRLRVLDQPGQEIILADAQVSPIQHKQILKYILARRAGETLRSAFVGVMEPFGDAAYIESVRVACAHESGGRCLAVRRSGGETDLVVLNPARVEMGVEEFRLSTTAAFAVITLDGQGAVRRFFCADGAGATLGEQRYTYPGPLQGTVQSVTPGKGEIRIAFEGTMPDPATLAGRVAHFGTGGRRVAHPIAACRVDAETLVVTVRDDLLVGRAHVTSITPEGLGTDSKFMFAPVYRGAWVSDAGFGCFVPLNEVSDGILRLRDPLPADAPFAVGRDAWIVNVGPGDRFEVTPTLER